MKYIILSILMISSYFSVIGEEFEYIKSPLEKYDPIRSIKFNTAGNIYFHTLGDSIYKYDIDMNKYTHYPFDNSNGLNTVRAIEIDPDGNVIILSMQEAFFFKDNKWLSLKEKIGEHAVADWTYSLIYKDNSGNLYFGIDKLIKYSKDSYSIIKEDEWGFKKFFYHEDELLFFENSIIFADNAYKDYIYFLDPESPSKSLIYDLKNTVKPDTAYISKIQNIGNEIFLLLDHKDKKPPNSFKDFYVLLDGKVKKLAIEYFKKFKTYYIRDFITTKNSELLIAIDIFDETLKEFHPELVYVDRNGNLIKTYLPPKFLADSPNDYFGKEFYPIFIYGMTESLGSVYMISTFGYFDGIFKFTPTHVGIEEDKSFVSEITICPNPLQNGKTLYVSLDNEKLCNAEVKIYDELGSQISESQEITIPIGSHTINYTPSSLSPGTYFIVISSDGEVLGREKFVVVE